MIKELVMAIFLISLVLVVSGCVSTGNIIDESEFSSNPPEILQPPPTTPETPEVFKIGQTLTNNRINFVVNSVEKINYISEHSRPKEGFIYLVVDFSIENIGLEEGYYFNANNLELEDENHYSYDYSWDSSNLHGYLGSTTVDIGRTKNGKLAFEVDEKTKGYTLILKSNMWGRGLVYIDLGTVENPKMISSAGLEIKKVDYDWYGDYLGGAIYSIDVTVKNTGNSFIMPKYDIVILDSFSMKKIYDDKDVEPILFDDINPEEEDKHSISFFDVNVEKPSKYSIIVTLKDQNGKVLDTKSKDIVIG